MFSSGVENMLGQETSTFSLILKCQPYLEEGFVCVVGSVHRQLCRKMQLDVVKVSKGGTELFSTASNRTKAVLFGSCSLEVKQTLSFSEGDATITLEWLHPIPADNELLKLSHVLRGVKKRANFVQLFNTSFTHQVREKLIQTLKSWECGCSLRGNAMGEVTDLGCSCSFTRVKCSEDLKRLLRERTSSELKFEVAENAVPRVRFSDKNTVIEFPLTVADREARMSLDSPMMLNDAEMPLRSVKTGKYVWFDEEIRQKIAPFNYIGPLAADDDVSMRKSIAPFNYEFDAVSTIQSRVSNGKHNLKKRVYEEGVNSMENVSHRDFSVRSKRKWILKNCLTKRIRHEVHRMTTHLKHM